MTKATSRDKDGFAGLTHWGTYDHGKLPRVVYQIPADGTIRLVKELGIPYRRVMRVNENLVHAVCGYAILTKNKRKLQQAVDKRDESRASRAPSPHPDLILCIREASRAAHRERDAASEAYDCGCHVLAGNASQRKNDWYALKDRGIVIAHKQGLLCYIGPSPQGMAIYEYGDGGMSCFHSTLHPAGVERTPIDGHPETLLVDAKGKAKGISLERVKITLSTLPDDATGYECSVVPRIERPTITCWNCGEEGHLARHCPERDDDYFEDCV
jgi:hypothetical protein